MLCAQKPLLMGFIMRYPDGKVFRDTKCSCHPQNAVARPVNYHASTYVPTAHRACCDPCVKGEVCDNALFLYTPDRLKKGVKEHSNYRGTVGQNFLSHPINDNEVIALPD